MTFVLTLVGADRPLADALVAEVEAEMGAAGCSPGQPTRWEAEVVEIPLARQPPFTTIQILRENLASLRVDLFVTLATNRRKKLMVADMDATIVTGETLDELAAHAGLQDRISAITQRAMAGELDFPSALRERVGLLKGLREQALRETLDQIELSPGAATLVGTMARHGATCVLVSGGFTFFTGEIAARAGFHHHHGNTLGIVDGLLSGFVGEPILDKGVKLSLLHGYAAKLGIPPEETFAIGDGANDLPMLQAAGLGIGYHPKPLLLGTLPNCIIHGDLTAALFAQGYRRAEFSAG
jgi:phosphoserine phosphatase